MLGLDYSSSDEDEVGPPVKEAAVNAEPAPKAPNPLTAGSDSMVSRAELNGTLQGPPLGPAQDPSGSPLPVDEDRFDDTAPVSPYTSSRSAIRNLTLPTVPNFDIPPSPPGSPPQRATKKFAQFLELKKKGQHFNQRLETSSVMKDPGHLQRLLDFAGITEGQYASTLSAELAVPTLWPEWAYVEHLSESRKQILKVKEQENVRSRRDKVDFVKATVSGTPNGTAPSGGGGKVGAQSAAERIKAGISGRKADFKVSRDIGRKRELEHRGSSRDYSSRSKNRSRSRSPRRRRSRSSDRDRRHDIIER